VARDASEGFADAARAVDGRYGLARELGSLGHAGLGVGYESLRDRRGAGEPGARQADAFVEIAGASLLSSYQSSETLLAPAFAAVAGDRVGQRAVRRV